MIRENTNTIGGGVMYSSSCRDGVVLRQLSEKLGAEYIERFPELVPGARIHGAVHSVVGPWKIVISSHDVHFDSSLRFEKNRMRYQPDYTHVEIHATYVNPDGFRFSIAPRGIVSHLARKIGLSRHIELGFSEFDEAFLVKGNNDERVRSLFTDPKLRERILAHGNLRIDVKHRLVPILLGPKPSFPENVDILLFRLHVEVTDIELLEGLRDLLVSILERLCQVGSALREPPGVEIRGSYSFTSSLSRSETVARTEDSGGGGSARPRELLHRERQAAVSSSGLANDHERIGSMVRRGAFGCFAFVILLILGVLTLTVGSVVLANWRVDSRYVANSCVVLDKRLEWRKEKISTPNGWAEQDQCRPDIKIRYEVDGRKYELGAYDASRLYAANQFLQQSLVDDFVIGATYPCWTDPDHPEKVVLVRGQWGLFSPKLMIWLLVELGLIGGLYITYKQIFPRASEKGARGS